MLAACRRCILASTIITITSRTPQQISHELGRSMCLHFFYIFGNRDILIIKCHGSNYIQLISSRAPNVGFLGDHVVVAPRTDELASEELKGEEWCGGCLCISFARPRTASVGLPGKFSKDKTKALRNPNR